jgi:hypothetical protein
LKNDIKIEMLQRVAFNRNKLQSMCALLTPKIRHQLIVAYVFTTQFISRNLFNSWLAAGIKKAELRQHSAWIVTLSCKEHLGAAIHSAATTCKNTSLSLGFFRFFCFLCPNQWPYYQIAKIARIIGKNN